MPRYVTCVTLRKSLMGRRQGSTTRLRGCRRRFSMEDNVTETPTPAVAGLSLAFLGGTGDQGRGLARRFAIAGNPVIIGSRQAERATQAADELGKTVPDASLVTGVTNEEA